MTTLTHCGRSALGHINKRSYCQYNRAAYVWTFVCVA
nr:MAG TPA: hypothetical protein [Caudoviricetes sp.]